MIKKYNECTKMEKLKIDNWYVYAHYTNWPAGKTTANWDFNKRGEVSLCAGYAF